MVDVAPFVRKYRMVRHFFANCHPPDTRKMDMILLIAGILCLLGGLAGAVLPSPGPPLSFAGLLLLHFSSYASFSGATLWTFGLATLLITVLDYYIPVWGTKKFGGTRYGSIGAVAGLLAGLLVLPGLGIFAGTFLGAMAGELVGGAPLRKALKAAFGAFAGFVTGMAMKIVLCLAMLVWVAVQLFT